jgi:hypothetical protein
MFTKIKNFLGKLNNIQTLNMRILRELHAQKTILGKGLSNKLKERGVLADLHEAEFQVFSQWGDDGIIQYLINQIENPTKTFIEFGVENYAEANTRFLLINDNWSGLVMDGSERNIAEIQKSELYWRYDLTAKCAFIDKDNINELISSAGFKGDIGILSIDLDGVDYWIWQNLNVVNPEIVIVEYNSTFGSERTITVPYKKDFLRQQEHFSYLYFGASLGALCSLAEEKGYYFVGSNSHGVNAYFVRRDKMNKLKPITAKEGYMFTKSRESRDEENHLNYTAPKKRLDVIKGLKVFNVKTNKEELL